MSTIQRKNAKLARRTDRKLAVCQCRAPVTGEAYFPFDLRCWRVLEQDTHDGGNGTWREGGVTIGFENGSLFPIRHTFHDPRWLDTGHVKIDSLNYLNDPTYQPGGAGTRRWSRWGWSSGHYCYTLPTYQNMQPMTGATCPAPYDSGPTYGNITLAAATRAGDDLLIEALWTYSYALNGTRYSQGPIQICGSSSIDAVWPYYVTVTPDEQAAAEQGDGRCAASWQKKFVRMCQGYVHFTLRSVGCKITAAELAAMAETGASGTLLCRIKKYPVVATLETNLPGYGSSPTPPYWDGRGPFTFTGSANYGAGCVATTRRWGFWNSTWSWTSWGQLPASSPTSYTGPDGFVARSTLPGSVEGGTSTVNVFGIAPWKEDTQPTEAGQPDLYVRRCHEWNTNLAIEIVDSGSEVIDWMMEKSAEKRRVQMILLNADLCCRKLTTLMAFMSANWGWTNLVLRARRTTLTNYTAVSAFDNTGWTTLATAPALFSYAGAWTYFTLPSSSSWACDSHLELCWTFDQAGGAAAPGQGYVTGWNTGWADRAMYASAAFLAGAADPLTWTVGGTGGVSAITKTGILPRLRVRGILTA